MNREEPQCARVCRDHGARHRRDRCAAGAEARSKEVGRADPTGPTTALAFDTDEGTSMNVDVSPDGTQIVFDLLGDIYLMPIGGSATPARRLTSGPAFDSSRASALTASASQ